MSKKLLTKLLAVVMSAGLVMQPVAAFAAEAPEEEPEETPALELDEEPEETPAPELDEEDYILSIINDVTLHYDGGDINVYMGGEVPKNLDIYDPTYGITVEFLGWQLLGENGWEDFTEDYFNEDGSYRFRVSLSLDEEAKLSYTLDSGTQVTLNGADTLIKDNISYDDEGLVEELIFASNSYTIMSFEPIDPPIYKITYISSLHATSDFESFPVYGDPIDVDNISFVWEEEYYPVCFVGNWSQKIDDEWVRCVGIDYEEGTYRLELDMQIRPGFEFMYVFDTATKLIVNGKEWTFVEYIYGDKNIPDTITFASDGIDVSNGDDPFIPIAGEGHWVTKYGATYYVYPGGFRVTGMREIGGDYYLFSQNGTLQKNVFYEEDGNKYYFGSEGKMIKGWFEKWSSTYYANEDGVIQTGFVDIGEDTYYMDSAGKRASSIWVVLGGNRYYVKVDGRLAKSQTIHKWGKAYTFDENGVLISQR